MHNFVRGLDSSPGAIITLEGKETKVFGSRMWTGPTSPAGGVEVDINTTEDSTVKGIVHSEGLLITGGDGKQINIGLLSVEGKFVKASKYGQAADAGQDLVLTEEEMATVDTVKEIWTSILKVADITDETDFFSLGAGSMDVVRLIEEIKDRSGITMTNEVSGHLFGMSSLPIYK